MEKYPIWFFSTGSILTKIKNQNKPFHYALVFHDRDNKTTLPAAEFITTCHTSTSISQYLLLVRKFYQQISGSLNSSSLPKMIVTDQSWALINAASETFNYCSVSQYLDWCYKIIVEKNHTVKHNKNTLLYVCSTHFLKVIIIKVEKTKAPKHVKFFFKRLCGSLLNSITLEEFESTLERMYYVFCSEKKTMLVLDSSLMLRRDLGNKILSDTIKINEDEHNEYIEALEYSISEEGEWKQPDNITRDYPFTAYFEKKISYFCNNQKEKNDNNGDQNEYFYPDLMKIICKKLYMMPLWSGIMLQHLKEKYPHINETTRVSNNIVESYFSHLKNSILNGEGPVLPSQLVGPLFQRILSKFLKFYQLRTQPLQCKKPSVEKWKKRDKQNHHKKGIYFENINFFDTELLEYEKNERMMSAQEAMDLEEGNDKRKLEGRKVLILQKNLKPYHYLIITIKQTKTKKANLQRKNF
jgi:hypothetical protein